MNNFVRHFTISACCLFLLVLTAQNQQSFEIPLSAVTNFKQQQATDLFPSLVNFKAPSPGGESYRDYLAELRGSIRATGEELSERRGNAPQPSVLRSFASLDVGGEGIPNDNDLAISNGGKLITVMNSIMEVYDITEPDSLAQSLSLASFAEPLGSYQFAFDPKVEYDPVADRFIICFLHQYSSLESKVIIGFSQSNDPEDDWNLYEIPGSPLGGELWTDYPMLGLTNGELFLTVNLLTDGLSWQEGFDQTLIWQFDKEDGYAGEALNSMLHTDIGIDGKTIRNLHPVKGGQGLLGPNMYFLSNRNFDLSNDSIFLVEVSGEMETAELTVQLLQADIPYGVPPFGRQADSRMLDTNDGRILGSYLRNDRIHFVSVCSVPETGYSGIYHGVINSVSGAPTLNAEIISDPVLDLGYPNISFTGQEASNDQGMINFLHTAPNVNAGNSVVFFNEGGYSDFTTLKEGEYFIGAFSSLYSRWGDYTGSQPKHNEPGTVWVIGSWARKIGSGPLPVISGKARSWVSEIRTNDIGPQVGVEESATRSTTTLFPNPSSNRFSVSFELAERKTIIVSLLNLEGKTVRTVLESYAKTGSNELSFATDGLANGLYVLRITDESGKRILEERVVVQH